MMNNPQTDPIQVYCPPDDQSNGQCLNDNFISSISESVHYIENLLPGTLLNVDFFDTYTGVQLSSTPFDEIANVLSDGKAYFTAPTMDETKPDWAFKFYEGPEFRSTVKEPELRDTAVCPGSVFEVAHLLRNFTDSNSILRWEYNEVLHQGLQTSFIANMVSSADILLYITSHNQTDTLIAKIYIKDCNYQPAKLQTKNYQIADSKVKELKKFTTKNETEDREIFNQQNLLTVDIYPVPSSGMVNVEFKGEISTWFYQVNNAIGELILEGTWSQNKLMLDLSKQAKGFYTITISAKDLVTKTNKLILQ